jgi:hypothetical protein
MITLTREEAEAVLDALLGANQFIFLKAPMPLPPELNDTSEAIKTLRARLSAPEPKNKAMTHEENKLHNQKILDEFYKENAALYEPEPVACKQCGVKGIHACVGYRWEEGRTPPNVTFTAPPQREWVGLTDEEIIDTANNAPFDTMVSAEDYIYVIVRAIEAKLREKNT